jgi:CheY-like chemotaxis protein
MNRSILLHVEDEEAVAYLFRAAVEEAGVAIETERVANGEEALKFLRNTTPYENASTPDLVVLDLNLPRVDGWAVLNAMQEDSALRTIPVAILSTTGSQSDKKRAMAAGARRYITKPDTFEGLIDIVRSMYKDFLGPNGAMIAR